MNLIKHYTLPALVLLSGIFLSTISAYYSILGLISIFSGSALLITFMGIGLEASKIMGCLFLHKHWNDKIGFLKLYLSVAVIILMMITSLGVYGFLTKANLAQSEGVNLNLAKVTALEDNIQREQSKLDLNSQQITQYNELLSKLITQDVRRASNERRRIQSEIKVLAKESKEITKTIDNLNTELLPFKSEINAVEVEVGTLLYISKLIHGDQYKEYLPQTLTVLTLLIIFVFDPLAIGLLIASQKSFRIISFEDARNELKSDIKLTEEKYNEVVAHYNRNPLREATDEEHAKISDKENKNYENALNARSSVLSSTTHTKAPEIDEVPSTTKKYNLESDADELLQIGFNSYIEDQFNESNNVVNNHELDESEEGVNVNALNMDELYDVISDDVKRIPKRHRQASKK